MLTKQIPVLARCLPSLRVLAPEVAPRELGFRLLPHRGQRLPTVEVDGEGRLPLLRLSPADLSCLIERPDRYRAGTAVRLRLDEEMAPIEGVVTASTSTCAGPAALEVRFDGIGRDAALEVQGLLLRLIGRGLAVPAHDPGYRETETITDPARIRTALRALFADGASGRLWTDGASPRTVTTVKAVRLEPTHPQPLHLNLDLEEPWPAPPFTLELEGTSSVFRFTAATRGEADGYLALPVPTEIRRWRRRWHRRIPAPPGVQVCFRHPLFPELWIRRPVQDVAVDGVGFATSRFGDLVYPGMVVGEVIVQWRDRLRLQFRGVVSHVTTPAGGASDLAGMHLTPVSSDDAARWEAEVDPLLHPTTRMDGAWSRELWELYARSGYFNLSGKSERDFEHLREPFDRTSRVIARHPELGCQVVFPSVRGVEAAVSVLKIYQRSVFMFQLARQRGRTPAFAPGRQILRDIYRHAVENTQRDPDLRWLVVWVQESGRFSRLLQYQITERYLPSGRSYVQRFHAMEGSTAEVPVATLLEDVEIGRARPRELARLAELLAARRPASFLEAHDLVPEHLDLRRLQRAWADAGLRREREVLVARRGGQACAAAVLECADDGLHLFGLLDLVRLFALDDEGRDLFTPLLDRARAFYAERNKRTFCYYLEGDDLSHATSAGLKDLGAADLTVLPSELLPELLEHVHEITPPRESPSLGTDHG